jgi:hypothetical protein
MSDSRSAPRKNREHPRDARGTAVAIDRCPANPPNGHANSRTAVAQLDRPSPHVGCTRDRKRDRHASIVEVLDTLASGHRHPRLGTKLLDLLFRDDGRGRPASRRDASGNRKRQEVREGSKSGRKERGGHEDLNEREPTRAASNLLPLHAGGNSKHYATRIPEEFSDGASQL